MAIDTEERASEETTALYSGLSQEQKRGRLRALAAVFFRLGIVAFGGPAAHVAMMDDEIVKRRQWMSRENLLDLIGVTNLLPGPNSTELAIHIGYERAGWTGLFVAGSCFIFPAMSLVWLLAAVYVQYQTVPQVSWLLYGIKPVIIAVVLRALFKLGKKAAKDTPTTVAGVVAIAAYFFGFNEVLILLISGLVVMAIKVLPNRGNLVGAFLLPFTGNLTGTLTGTLTGSSAGSLTQAGSVTAAAASSVVSVGWASVFLFFLKVGSVLYGSGYVLLAFLQRDLVERHQWITSQQLLDAVAIGQITPGPVLTTATFVGYLVAGNGGAIAGTFGIFLPAFLLVGIVNPWVPKLRRSPWASAFLDGVNAASLGLMGGVTYTLARAAVIDIPTLLVAIASAIAVFYYKVNAIWLVLAGALIGYLIQLTGLAA